MSRRGWVGFDLDRTLAVYDGWVSPTHIGAPVPKAVARVRHYLAYGEVDVRVFTARMSDPDPAVCEAIQTAIGDWTEEHVGTRLGATCVKDYDCVRLYDDIARQMIPNTGIVVSAD